MKNIDEYESFEDGDRSAAPSDEYYRLQRFMFYEARLLNEERYQEWLSLLTDDVHYWMPNIELFYRKNSSISYSVGDIAHFDDDKDTLQLRVNRFGTGLAWPEDPPTRRSLAIGNLEVFLKNDFEYYVYSTFSLYRSKLLGDAHLLHGRREDIVRKVDNSLKISKRVILLTDSTLTCKNLNVFI